LLVFFSFSWTVEKEKDPSSDGVVDEEEEFFGQTLGGIPKPPRRQGLYYVPGKDIVNGSEQDFETVPDQLFSSGMFLNIVCLKLSRNKLSEIDLRLAKLQKLTQLGLDENSLGHLPEELCLLTNLQMLDVRHNKLVGLPKEIWRLQKLSKLFLQNNLIKKLPTTISQLTSLESLALRGNVLKQLPAGLGGGLLGLTILDLADNKLTSIDELAGMRSLKRLYLKNNLIASIPSSVSSLSSIVHLTLSSNKLEKVDSLCSLHELAELDLSQNSLKELPLAMGQLANLKLLYVDNNRLSSFPASLGTLVKLEELHAAHNELCKIPSLEGLEQLNTLDLSYNQFKEFPDVPGAQLRMLKINGNELETLPPSLKLYKLNTLDLGFNHLVGPLPGLAGLTTLQVLFLNSNVLRKFPPPIASLKKLNVEGNELESLPIDIYKFAALVELNISNNQLDDLPVTIVAITSLHLLVLDGNPFGAIPESIERRGVPMWHYLISCAQELSEQNAKRQAEKQ
jgi:leucine-rich repeat protein SHOC2